MKPWFELIVLFFALYGFISIAQVVSATIGRRAKRALSGVQIAILVRNQENSIEGLVRTLYSCDLPSRVNVNCRVNIVDLDSTDQTVAILKRLERQYPGLYVLENSEREKLFEQEETELW